MTTSILLPTRTFEFHGKTFELAPLRLFRLRCTDLQPHESMLRVPHPREISEAVGEDLEIVEVADFNDTLVRAVADRPAVPDPADGWETWHAMRCPPPDLGKPGYWRLWLQWAIARFPLFRDLPQPSAYDSGSAWALAFQAAVLNEIWDKECDWLARELLDCWNDNYKWKVARARSLRDLSLRLDAENRRGLAALIVHAKGIG